MFELIHSVFDVLPFAGVVDEAVLVLHGGIGDGRWELNKLRLISRPITQTYEATESLSAEQADLLTQVSTVGLK